MEPTVESLILHPAVLIASGFDCITSAQVRFLNAHRRHFHTKLFNLNETLSITAEQFTLGGILNPYGHFHDVEEAYKSAAREIANFPYVTRREILKHYYKEDLSRIWSEMMMELFMDLSCFCVEQKRSRDYFMTSTKVIHELYPHVIYQKVSALHLCGLGDKLIHAFGYVFRLFNSYEDRRAEPTVIVK